MTPSEEKKLPFCWGVWRKSMRLCIPHYRSSIDTCRFVLILCVCLNLFGVPTAVGGTVQIFLNFAPCAFFIFSGYLVLRDTETQRERIIRSIRRSGVTFAALFVSYLALNLTLEREYTLMKLSSRRFWFDFVVFNNWNLPIGRPIWFVQAMFYAYIILYFLHRWNLLRYDWIIAAIFLIVALLTGELSGLIHFQFLGETFIPGNFFTRALPYLLIGHLMRRKEPFLIVVGYHAWWITAVGIGMMIGECILLRRLGVFTYYGHLLGMGVIAVVVCSWVITCIDDIDQPFAVLSFRRNATLMTYYLCSPVYYFLIQLITNIDKALYEQIASFIGVAVIMVCLCIALIHEVLIFLFWPVQEPPEDQEQAALEESIIAEEIDEERTSK